MDPGLRPAWAGQPTGGKPADCETGHPTSPRIHYERRRPEDTVLYQIVQEHLETFLAQVEAETGSGLPDFVKAEFEAFLECGILAHGFLRLRCTDWPGFDLRAKFTFQLQCPGTVCSFCVGLTH
jgi:hypothetical protein